MVVLATIAVLNAMLLRGWSDVMGSGALAIDGRIAVKQMDDGAEDAFIFTRLNMISREIYPGRQRQIQKDIKVPKSIYDIRDFRRKTSTSK